jgi:hypothetical protein
MARIRSCQKSVQAKKNIQTKNLFKARFRSCQEYVHVSFYVQGRKPFILSLCYSAWTVRPNNPFMLFNLCSRAWKIPRKEKVHAKNPFMLSYVQGKKTLMLKFRSSFFLCSRNENVHAKKSFMLFLCSRHEIVHVFFMFKAENLSY